MKTNQNIQKAIVRTLSVIAIMFFIIHQAKATCNIQAGFTYTVNDSSNVVDFISTTISDTTISSWTYNFDDGTVNSNAMNATHAYVQNGIYNVCLTVSDANNCIDTFCKTIFVFTDTAICDTNWLSQYRNCDSIYNYIDQYFSDSLGILYAITKTSPTSYISNTFYKCNGEFITSCNDTILNNFCATLNIYFIQEIWSCYNNSSVDLIRDTNQINSIQDICLPYQTNYVFDTIFILNNSNSTHSQNQYSIIAGTSCISIKRDSSQGYNLDTVFIITVDSILQSDTITLIISNTSNTISQPILCDIINQDTIRLSLNTTLNGSYNLSVLYDSTNMQQHPFVLEEWSSATNTLTPNRLFTSVVQLYQYIDSVANGIFEYDSNYLIYSTNPNAISYTSGNGLKIFIPSTSSTYQIPFFALSSSSATYCSSLENGRYRFDNPTWNFINFCSPNNVAFNFNQIGIFPTNIYDSINHCVDQVVFVVENSTQTLCDTITCLLPGDADHDLFVNNYDVLAIGLSYNRTGNVRPNATSQYTLQACDDWSTTHYYGYNDKFADCNGDGRINSSDALVINQNYIVQAQNHFNHRQNQLDSLPTVTLNFDTLPTMVINGNCDGAELVADINVGNPAQPIIDGYGVAFSVNYPFDNDSCFDVQVDLDPNSWFQTNNPVLLFYKNIPQFNRVDISIARTDGTPRSGNGRIGKIKMITEGAVFRGGRITSNKQFTFSVNDVVAVNQLGQRIDINGSSTTVNFVVAGVKQNKVDGLRLYPNPTHDKIYINAKEMIESIRVLDLSGRVIEEFLPNKNEIQLDLSGTENGMYIIEIKGKNTVSYEKIFKQ